MNKSVLQAVIAFLFGNKYYANIINTKGTNKCEITSFIHRTKQEAEEHRHNIESTMSFIWIETISFRSRKKY